MYFLFILTSLLEPVAPVTFLLAILLLAFFLCRRYLVPSPPRFVGGGLVPSPPSTCLIGNIDLFSRGGTLQALLDIQAATKLQDPNSHGIACVWIGLEPVLIITKRQHIADICDVTSARKLVEAVNIHTREFMGRESIVSKNGDEWSHIRSIITGGIISPSRIRSTFAPISAAAKEFASKLAERQSEPTTEVYHLIKELTMKLISQIIFSDSRSAEQADIPNLFQLMLDVYNDRQLSLNPLNLCYWLPTKVNRDRNRARDKVRGFLTRIVEERVAKRKRLAEAGEALPEVDGVDCMLADPNIDYNEPKDKELVIDNLLTLLFAGFDTTAIALTCCLHFLAKNKHVQDRVVKEIADVLKGNEVTPAHVAELVYLRKVIFETLRMMTPAPLSSRVIEKDFTLVDRDDEGNETPVIHIKKGTQVWPAFALSHRSPLNFSDPDVFNPSRWDPKPDASRDITASSPVSIDEALDRGLFAFSGGSSSGKNRPRRCPGRELALLEVTTVLATILQHIEVSAPPDSKIELGRCAVVLALQGCSISIRARAMHH